MEKDEQLFTLLFEFEEKLQRNLESREIDLLRDLVVNSKSPL
ncbi:hypothetical protein BleG1_0264 [Shouchella lehensis G1]|uniref:Uncharacterized protein n=1 Tax=Shouchella lehensis G1 TaxID=1246626 RepID=A0A060LRT5_9BACI|nr:hypothetical protein BleG1_0264 [Shouchella lehensis G1]